MPSPILARAFYSYSDIAEVLRVAEEFAARDRRENRPTCYVCDCQPDIDEQCKLCRLEGALADARVLILCWYDEMSRSACNCPRIGGKLQHVDTCLVEQAAERCREMRQTA